MRFHQRGAVVNAVADIGDRATLLFERRNDARLVFRLLLIIDRVEPQGLSKGFGRRLMVAVIITRRFTPRARSRASVAALSARNRSRKATTASGRSSAAT